MPFLDHLEELRWRILWSRLQRMRQRSSSRWSRNGISPRGVIFGYGDGR